MSDPMNHGRPMSLSAFCKCWHCDAEFERDGDSEHWVIVWEPLDTDAPADARPYVYGSGEIDFYDRTGNIDFYDRTGYRMLARRVRYHCLNDSFPNLLLMSDGVWREAGLGSVVHRDGRWWVRSRAADNTRAARMMNAGWAEYRK
jgi:hypothetical protein